MFIWSPHLEEEVRLLSPGQCLPSLLLLLLLGSEVFKQAPSPGKLLLHNPLESPRQRPLRS